MLRFLSIIYIVATVASYLAAISQFSSRASSATPATRTVTAPAAATISAGASYTPGDHEEHGARKTLEKEAGPEKTSVFSQEEHRADFEHDSVSLAKRGGDLQSSRVPRETGHEAQAPAGTPSLAPAGAFISHESPPACQCGANCQCRAEVAALKESVSDKNEMLSEFRAMVNSLESDFETKLAAKHADLEAAKYEAYRHSTALAQRPAPVQPVPAPPAAVPYMPAYCSGGNCQPVRSTWGPVYQRQAILPWRRGR